MANNDAFITGLEVDDLVMPVRTSAKETRAPQLEQVRKDHFKLMGVVRTFGEKVGGMIDKQRYEFMTAYEHHIQDIQDELQSLREKVAEISGDETRKAKLETLDVNQTKFKTEALHLDTETLAQRKRLRKLVNQLHSVERDRDWVFKRLKTAKKHYLDLVAMKDETLTKARTSFEASVNRGMATGDGGGQGASAYYAQQRAMQGQGGDGMSVGSMESNESDFSLHINTLHNIKHQAQSAADIKKGLKQIYGVHREQALLSTLPHILPVSTQAASLKPHAQTTQALLQAGQRNQKQLGHSASLPQNMNNTQSQSQSQQYGALESSPTKGAIRKSREERDAIGELVALRARQEEIRDFVAQCASSCDRGPWAAIPKRSIEELLRACMDVVVETENAQRDYYEKQREDGSQDADTLPNPDPCEEKRLMLAMELAAVPEVYFIISDLAAGHDSAKHKIDLMREAAWSAKTLAQSRYGTEEYPLSTADTNAAAGRQGGSRSNDNGNDDGDGDRDGIRIKNWSASATSAGSNNYTDRDGGDNSMGPVEGEGDGEKEWENGEGELERERSAVERKDNYEQGNEFSSDVLQALDGSIRSRAGEDQNHVKINDWYDPNQPRTATGNSSRPSAIPGFYRGTGKGNTAEIALNNVEVDLIGGDDLGQWLLRGARERQHKRKEAESQRLRASGAEMAEDFMNFD